MDTSFLSASALCQAHNTVQPPFVNIFIGYYRPLSQIWMLRLIAEPVLTVVTQ